MIPKIIHYCWFGGHPLPASALKCIESWRKYCPDYEIKEWNETNYDVNKIGYISQAYQAKKYAFVSDYARFDILYQYGGIYFDTDVEVIKPIDDVIEKGSFFGMETVDTVNPGLGMAASLRDPLYAEILQYYEKADFIKPNGRMDLTTVVTLVTGILKKHGFTKGNKIQTVENLTIYPIDYFNPKDQRTCIITVTDNTYTIHHFDASWSLPLRKKYMEYSKTLIPKVGSGITYIILFPMRIICIIQEVGFSGLMRKISTKIPYSFSFVS